MKESIYIETSVLSYYTAKPSRNLIVLAHQQITWEWWHKALRRFEVYISEIVIEEAQLGNQESVKQRLAEIKKFNLEFPAPLGRGMGYYNLGRLKPLLQPVAVCFFICLIPRPSGAWVIHLPKFDKRSRKNSRSVYEETKYPKESYPRCGSSRSCICP